jgi:DNA-directed RNA polymerase specialized sigma24 family protein
MRALRTMPDGERSGSGGLPDAERAVTALYLTHYRPLVKIAVLLVRELATAEEIVQDSFVAVHAAWRTLPDPGHALSYLYRSVVDRSRVVPRQQVADRSASPSALISALWALPPRQREVVVLRYFADLPETQVALATGISEGAVRAHAAQAVSWLRTELGRAS